MDSDSNLSQDEFIVLIARHERRVRGFVATLVRQREDVEEVVQQACLTAWRKLPDFKRVSDATVDRDFVRWIFTIARFEALGYVRKQRGSSLLFDSKLVGELADLQIDNEVELEDRRQVLSSCIEKLSSDHKDLIRRYYHAERSAAEIAKQDGVSRQAIYKKLRAIRVALMECVGRSLGTAELG